MYGYAARIPPANGWYPGVPASGFLISMPTLFEDFVTTALAEELARRYGGRSEKQDRRWWLDTDRQVALRPDLVWYPDGGVGPGVTARLCAVARARCARPAGTSSAAAGCRHRHAARPARGRR